MEGVRVLLSLAAPDLGTREMCLHPARPGREGASAFSRSDVHTAWVRGSERLGSAPHCRLHGDPSPQECVGAAGLGQSRNSDTTRSKSSGAGGGVWTCGSKSGKPIPTSQTSLPEAKEVFLSRTSEGPKLAGEGGRFPRNLPTLSGPGFPKRRPLVGSQQRSVCSRTQPREQRNDSFQV